MSEKFGLSNENKNEQVGGAEVIEISVVRAAREKAPSFVVMKLGFSLDQTPSVEKLQAMKDKLTEFNAVINDRKRDSADRRLHFYGAELLAKQIGDDTEALDNERTTLYRERSTMPATPPEGYGGVARAVSAEGKQPLSPAAAYMRPA